jgi:two-component system sensor histidine kinase BarA
MNMMRKERPDNHTPIVALTANILNREEDRLLRLGFDYYLSKPIDEEKFRALIENSPEETTLIPGTAINQQSEYSESVNITQSLDLAANNASLLVQIFEILLRDIPHHKDQLAYAALQLDYAKLSSIVHKVHGITCYTSLPRLRALVVSIQQQLAQESYSLIATTVTEMIEEFEQIRLQVESYLQQAVDEVEESGDQEIIKFS